MRRRVARGDVFRLILADTRGHEQRGPRYGVIVQDDDYNDLLATAVVVPTSTTALRMPLHVPLTIEGRRSYALVEQLLSVDTVSRLREWVDNISGTSEFGVMEEQLRYLLAFSED